jgi:glycosyltransferase involved in cell wall biosynthesis
MRVLYLAPAGPLGGAERVLLDVIHGVRNHVSAGVLAFSEGPLINEVRSLGIPVEVVPLPPSVARLGEQSGSSWDLLARVLMSIEQAALPGCEFIRRCRRVVDEFRPDLVHSNGLKAHLLARLMCGNRPLILHVHDFYAQRALTRHLLGRVVSPPLTLLAISRATAADVALLFPSSPIELIYNAVDTEYFSPGRSDARRLDELARLPESPAGVLRAGLVATYASWKGHDVFLRAAALLSEWGHAARFRFYIVGAPIYSTSSSQRTAAELRRRAAELGVAADVGFIDFQDDIASVYRSLSFVVHASTGPEPFGRTIIEGMACQKAILSTATGGAGEIFEPGVSGLRIVPGSAGSLAANLLALADDRDKTDRLCRQARQTALARFDRRRLTGQMLGVYARALGRQHQRSAAKEQNARRDAPLRVQVAPGR